MELNKDHRASLINQLDIAKEEQEIRYNQLQDPKQANGYIEAIHFLATERIKLIEKSLIDNDIDY